MSRPHRCWVPEGIYHLTLRGNNRQPIFLDEADHQHFLVELDHARAHYPFRLLAFALMPNHVHLVVEASPQASVSDTMRQVAASYTRYFNDRYQRVGHLYQGRFYSNFVNRDAHLLEVTRYVHLNPFRARLAQRVIDYPWTSYKAYLGIERNPQPLVEPERILSLFGSTPAEQAAQYRRFVEDLATQEREIEAWLRRLYRNRLIPPPRWLKK